MSDLAALRAEGEELLASWREGGCAGGMITQAKRYLERVVRALPEPAPQPVLTDVPRSLPLATPGNESREHFRLKHFVRRYLNERGATACATEVGFPAWRTKCAPWAGKSMEEIEQIIDHFPGRARCALWATCGVVDCVAIMEGGDAVNSRGSRRSWTPEDHDVVSVGVEVKVSRGDFLSGYHTVCDFNYVLTPPNLIREDEVPEPTGILVGSKCHKWGIRMVRRAGRRSRSALSGPSAAVMIASKLSGVWEWKLADDLEDEWEISRREPFVEYPPIVTDEPAPAPEYQMSLFEEAEDHAE